MQTVALSKSSAQHVIRRTALRPSRQRRDFAGARRAQMAPRVLVPVQIQSPQAMPARRHHVPPVYHSLLAAAWRKGLGCCSGSLRPCVLCVSIQAAIRNCTYSSPEWNLYPWRPALRRIRIQPPAMRPSAPPPRGAFARCQPALTSRARLSALPHAALHPPPLGLWIEPTSIQEGCADCRTCTWWALDRWAPQSLCCYVSLVPWPWMTEPRNP